MSVHIFHSFIHPITICVCYEALARPWEYSAEQDTVCPHKQIFPAGEEGSHKLIP